MTAGGWLSLERSGAPVGLALVALIAAGTGALAAEPVALAVTRHPLEAERPFETRVGRLEHRGTIEIKGRHAGFGGFSALRIGADGTQFLALSDNGLWMSGTFDIDARGWLRGASATRIGRLAGLDGTALATKIDRDAEAMALLADGSLLVAFEVRHRLWRYPPGIDPLAGRPVPFPSPAGLDRSPANMGIEALATLPDGRLLALTEGLMASDDTLQGWLWQDERWQSIRYRRHGDYRPTDAAALPGGGVVVVERRFAALTGLGIRIVRIDPPDLAPGAVIEPVELARLLPPQVIDNFEGIDARRGADGATLLYLIADDNFSPLQRTLIALFALID